ncbi:hypothetical protein SAMN04488587_1534 [Methanococcoides vulcani]|uniref:DUF1998 domain-containing protein n=1 Tax=Methanococcoides vulcani TaxID=1353158 RepID=A0A1I0ABX6_9EURY|nr:hypothetical protein [Methanococcoides vulcani]SES91243.1 hypothetical protein SAMN04488587_1534 [Methanococcoides vulcani]
MKNKYIHDIAESSCFFQGHKGQFFSRKYGQYLSFEVSLNFYDFVNDFNSERYKPIFSKLINKKISQRKADGGMFHEIIPDDLIIKKIKLVDDVDEEGASGVFKISPSSAICKKDGCYQYFEMNKGRTCGHKNNDPWEQFTFLAFCDECGRLLPLHYMTNIKDDCKKCGGKGTLLKLGWKGKDKIGSYKVQCTKCHDEQGLYFYKCDHTIRKTGEVLSTKKPKQFRGVPARSGAIVHPYVISIPDLSKKSNTDKKSNTNDILLSEAFNYFFSSLKEESKLSLPEFKSALSNEEEFWNMSKIKEIFEDVCDDLDLNLKIEEHNQLHHNPFLTFVQRVLKESKSRIDDGADEVKIKNRYGIIYIEKVLESVQNIHFSENDLQCSNLLYSVDRSKKEEPSCKPDDFSTWLNKFGLYKIVHFSDIKIIQALLGIIEGSTRRDPVLFRTIETGASNKQKPTVFARDFITEGVLFQLDFDRILQWLHANKEQIGSTCDIQVPKGVDAYTHFRNTVLNDDKCKEAVNTLLHTYSHMLIQQSTIDTGLDISSLSEIICPYTSSIFIYSTNSINIGGLEFTYEYHLEDWFSRVKELAEDCPQDPACMYDEGGACNSCSYIPEFVCYNFNQGLDRSTLVGNSERFGKGYLL